MNKPIAFGFYFRLFGYGFSVTTDYPPVCRKYSHPFVIFGIKFELLKRTKK